MTFDEKKATALATMIIKKDGEEKALTSEEIRPSMSYLKLIKLMYLCDRHMYKISQKFITNDDYFSMKLGPVLSNTLNLIKEDEQNADEQNADNQKYVSFWKKHIETIEYNVQVISNEDIDGLLDDTEKEIAEFFASSFIGVDAWRTVRFTHRTCPEWVNPTRDGFGVRPIEIRDIVKAIQMEETI